jgi:hypothetical protein
MSMTVKSVRLAFLVWASASAGALSWPLRFHKLALKSELERIIDMRIPMIFLTVLAPLLVTGWAEAQTLNDPGEAFIKHKKPRNFGPDYYVVRQGNSGKCSIVPGDVGDKPAGVVGDAPYASRQYAKTALEPLPNAKAGWLRTPTTSIEENRKPYLGAGPFGTYEGQVFSCLQRARPGLASAGY